MKKQTKQIISLISVIAFCLCAFVGCGYLYLKLDSRITADSADTDISSIPYSSVPQNVTLRYFFTDNSIMLLHLNFAEKQITAELSPQNGAENDYYLQPSRNAIAGFIDRLSGVELEQDGRVLRYTGLQAVTLFEQGAVEKTAILQAVFHKIKQNEITRTTLTYLLQNSDTDLSIPLCFSWPEWLTEMSGNIRIIE